MPLLTKPRLAAAGVVVAALTMFIAGVAFGAATPMPESVRITPAQLSIGLSGSPLEFGLQATGTTVVCPDDTAGDCPVVNNTGDVNITNFVVSFVNDPETSTSCTTGSWNAVTSSPGANQFVLNVDIGGTSYVNIAPSPGDSGNITFTLNTGVQAGVNLQLVLPSAGSTVPNSCDIVILVTASAP